VVLKLLQATSMAGVVGVPLHLGFKCFTLLTVAVCVGCSNSPPPLRAPKIDSGAATAAVAKYDANGNGSIEGDELAKIPAFKTSLKRVDKNGDSKITADEIDERIQHWRGLALALALVTVRQNGQPVAGAEVTFVPEEFLGPNVKAAHGTTDSSGRCNMKISSDPDERGVHLGYYRVQISKKSPDGKETIPARYNSETELGIEVSAGDPGLDHLTFDVSAH
jgi:hypothetical protein